MILLVFDLECRGQASLKVAFAMFVSFSRNLSFLEHRKCNVLASGEVVLCCETFRLLEGEIQFLILIS